MHIRELLDDHSPGSNGGHRRIHERRGDRGRSSRPGDYEEISACIWVCASDYSPMPAGCWLPRNDGIIHSLGLDLTRLGVFNMNWRERCRSRVPVTQR